MMKLRYDTPYADVVPLIADSVFCYPLSGSNIERFGNMDGGLMDD